MNAARLRAPDAAPFASWVPFLALVGAAATALALLTTAQEGIALAHEGQTVPWTGLLKARLVDWYACALFMPVLALLVRRFPIDRSSWSSHLPILLLAAVPVAIAKEAIFVAVGNLFRPGLFDLATILAEDLSYEVMAVWALMGVAHLLASPPQAAPRTVSDPAATQAPDMRMDGIRVRTRRGFEWVRTEEIELVDMQGNYARLVTPRGNFLVRETMARLELRLGAEFLRVHRRIVVRRDRIVRIETAGNGRYWIELVSGARLRSGRSFRRAIYPLRASGPRST